MAYAYDVRKDVARLNAVGDPFLARIAFRGLFDRYGASASDKS